MSDEEPSTKRARAADEADGAAEEVDETKLALAAFGGGDDGDDDEGGAGDVAGKTKKRRKKKAAAADDGDDGERKGKQGKKGGAGTGKGVKKGKGSAKKGRKRSRDDDDDDDEDDDDDDEDDDDDDDGESDRADDSEDEREEDEEGASVASFDDGYDEDLLGDDEDRARLEAMPELEREQVLAQRREQREEGRQQVEILRMGRAMGRKEGKAKKGKAGAKKDKKKDKKQRQKDKKKKMKKLKAGKMKKKKAQKGKKHADDDEDEDEDEEEDEDAEDDGDDEDVDIDEDDEDNADDMEDELRALREEAGDLLDDAADEAGDTGAGIAGRTRTRRPARMARSSTQAPEDADATAGGLFGAAGDDADADADADAVGGLRGRRAPRRRARAEAVDSDSEDSVPEDLRRAGGAEDEDSDSEFEGDDDRKARAKADKAAKAKAKAAKSGREAEKARGRDRALQRLKGKRRAGRGGGGDDDDDDDDDDDSEGGGAGADDDSDDGWNRRRRSKGRRRSTSGGDRAGRADEEEDDDEHAAGRTRRDMDGRDADHDAELDEEDEEDETLGHALDEFERTERERRKKERELRRASGFQLSLEDVNQSRAKRSYLLYHLLEPYFKQLVRGLFVRVFLGPHPTTQVPLYRLARIRQVVWHPRAYEVDFRGKRVRTNRRLELFIANPREQTMAFRLDQISEQRVTEEELKAFLHQHRVQNRIPPTPTQVRDRWARAETLRKTYVPTPAEVEEMLRAVNATFDPRAEPNLERRRSEFQQELDFLEVELRKALDRVAHQRAAVHQQQEAHSLSDEDAGVRLRALAEEERKIREGSEPRITKLRHWIERIQEEEAIRRKKMEEEHPTSRAVSTINHRKHRQTAANLIETAKYLNEQVRQNPRIFDPETNPFLRRECMPTDVFTFGAKESSPASSPTVPVPAHSTAPAAPRPVTLTPSFRVMLDASSASGGGATASSPATAPFGSSSSSSTSSASSTAATVPSASAGDAATGGVRKGLSLAEYLARQKATST